MTDVRIADLRNRYSTVLDQDDVDGLWVEDFGSDVDAVEMRQRLRNIFAARLEVDRILVRVDEHLIGSTGREAVSRDLGHAGSDGASSSTLDPGSGDGATLPGHSGDYRLITFVCASAVCGSRELRSYYDERAVPYCPHGAMRVQP